MKKAIILEQLQRHFPEIHDKNLQQAIANHGQWIEVSAQQTIVHFGDYIRLVPLIISGSIKVMREGNEVDQQLLLYYLNSGDTCTMSFSCCMERRKSEISTIAEEDTSLIAIPIEYVNRWMGEYSNWRNYVMRSYDQRQRMLVEAIDSIAFQQADTRLLEYLQNKMELQNSSTIHKTHLEIAQDLNISREAISRLLKKLEKNNVVKLSRNRIDFLPK